MKKWLLFGLWFIGLLLSLSGCGGLSTALTTCSPEATGQADTIEACLLTGYIVKNPQGERLGHIKNVFVDRERGQVAYVALAFDDPGVHSKAAMVTSKEKIALIPWEVLTPISGESVLLLNIEPQTLIDLPHFDRVPAGISPELAAEIHQHWTGQEYGQ